jgi:hypothetical protein
VEKIYSKTRVDYFFNSKNLNIPFVRAFDHFWTGINTRGGLSLVLVSGRSSRGDQENSGRKKTGRHSKFVMTSQ